MRLSSNGTKNLRRLAGVTSPEGVVAAVPGEIYQQGTETSGSFWIKGSGIGSTGWRRIGGSAPLNITSADFSGSDYQSTDLIGLVAGTNFDVWSNDGSGTLLLVNDGYTFNSTTGTITATAGNYKILIY